MAIPKPFNLPKQLKRKASVQQAECQGVMENAKLQVEVHERKAGIKRRYYERQVGLLQVRMKDLTLLQTLTLRQSLPLTP
jgi:hypothetical protein